MVFIVLFNLYLLHLTAGLVQGLPLEHALVYFVVVGLDEKHVLLQHANVLETA